MFSSIAEHANKHGILPLKKYSQNFIFDSSLCDKIVRVSGIKKNDIVLEVGPGIGGLTRSILKLAPKLLTVIEMDKRCIPLLTEIKSVYPYLHIIEGDALNFDLTFLNQKNINIISNLPYQIGTELVIRWLKQANLINSMTLMLQKEVVERIIARKNSKAYGRLSVICQLICMIEKCFDVSSDAFYPPPKVKSTIIKLIPKPTLLPPELVHKVEIITKAAFGQRRKMLKSSLKNLFSEESLKNIGISSSLRAENLSTEDYLSLAKHL